MMGSVDDNRKRNLTDGDEDMNSILSSKRGENWWRSSWLLFVPDLMIRNVFKHCRWCNSFHIAALRDAAISSGAETQDHLIKFLCPSAVAGSIIGRGGSVINELNQATGAKIKVSQNGEFFPTTNDRVIAVSGSMAAISAAIHELITKIIEVRWTVNRNFLSAIKYLSILTVYHAAPHAMTQLWHNSIPLLFHPKFIDSTNDTWHTRPRPHTPHTLTLPFHTHRTSHWSHTPVPHTSDITLISHNITGFVHYTSFSMVSTSCVGHANFRWTNYAWNDCNIWSDRTLAVTRQEKFSRRFIYSFQQPHANTHFNTRYRLWGYDRTPRWL